MNCNRNRKGQYAPNPKLSNLQMEAIMKMVWGNYASNNKVREELGIPNGTFYGWWDQDIFVEEIDRQREKKFKEMSSKAIRKLDELLNSKDSRTAIQAAKLILKENGHFGERFDITHKTPDSINIVVQNANDCNGSEDFDDDDDEEDF